MDFRFEHKGQLTFIGFSTQITPEEGYEKCPEFWDEEYNEKYTHLWQTMKPRTAVEQAILMNNIGMFAICSDNENGFEYWIAGLYAGGDIPEGLKLFTYPESEWAVFSTKGPLPDSLQTLNKQIMKEWLPEEGKKFNADMKTTVEVYSAMDTQSENYQCGIWIPVKK